MKGCENKSASCPLGEQKDKRALVLFLFGLGLVVLSLLPSWPLSTASYLAIVSLGKDGPWQCALVRQSTGPKPTLELTDGTRFIPASILFPSDTVPLPSELALFFRRPLAINACDQATLEMLPGIGPHLAAAIVRQRKIAGRFAGPDDLQAVPGIGPAKLRQMRSFIHFDPNP